MAEEAKALGENVLLTFCKWTDYLVNIGFFLQRVTINAEIHNCQGAEG